MAAPDPVDRYPAPGSDPAVVAAWYRRRNERWRTYRAMAAKAGGTGISDPASFPGPTGA